MSPITKVIIVSLATIVTSQFDKSECGRVKNCFLSNCDDPTDSACGMAFSFRAINDTHLEGELAGGVVAEDAATGYYVAVGFSTDNMMGNEFVTECSSLGSGPLSVKMSWNGYHNDTGKVKPTNYRLDTDKAVLPTLFDQRAASNTNGVFYCHFIQWISQLPSSVTTAFNVSDVQNDKFYLLLAKGPATADGVSLVLVLLSLNGLLHDL